MDDDTTITRDDTDSLDCLAAPFRMQAFERDIACRIDVDPVIVSVDPQ